MGCEVFFVSLNSIMLNKKLLMAVGSCYCHFRLRDNDYIFTSFK